MSPLNKEVRNQESESVGCARAARENGAKSIHSRSVNPNELESNSAGASNVLLHSDKVRTPDDEADDGHSGGDQE